jgi:hypothetical protein
MTGVIEQEWLHAVAGKALFYPAAGEDTQALVEAFAPHIREFHFNDLAYSTTTDDRSAAPDHFKLVSVDSPDPVQRNAPLQWQEHSKRPYRHIKPSELIQGHSDGETNIVIRRRRGFGQYALAHFGPGSIGVFVHRRDSTGESGSNLWFLANKRRDHEPLANLWNKLSQRLADRAIIVSDGCLTDFKLLRNATKHGEISHIPVKTFGGFEWRCIGRMTDHRGGFVWGIVRQ